MALGLNRDACLELVGLTKNQFYYREKGKRSGRSPTETTMRRDPETLETTELGTADVLQAIVDVKLDADMPNWYRLITSHLKLLGYYINHKKVYRLMKSAALLAKPRKRKGREFVKNRRICPAGPLKILEMDIKYVYIYGHRRNAFVFTIIDTFTRYVLHWDVGYTMKAMQVRAAWEHVIATYLQGQFDPDLEVEVRRDNGKQLEASLLRTFFKQNAIRHTFTHPYTPEENGYVESFHDTLGQALEAAQYVTLQQ